MPSVAPGDVVAGKYRVERMLGSGGMGYVVAARHVELGQLVAIKFLTMGALDLEGDERDAESLARFRREARFTARLTSEHVAKVQDVGVHTPEGGGGDEPFIVMEYLDGVDLGQLARQRPVLPVAEACDYVMQACEALAEAHAAGIVHRDVKPANLFLTKNAAGRPLLKVLDFGVSKTTGGANDEVTRTEMMVGSPKFMSPEQMKDPRSVDARTDIWSLGVVLYRLVCGHAPFDGETMATLCTMVLTQSPVPLSALRGDLPNGFEEVVAYCLVKDPRGRYADVATFAAALAPFTSDVERSTERVHHMAAVLGLAREESAALMAPVVATPTAPPFARVPNEIESSPPTVWSPPAHPSSRISIEANWSPPSGAIIVAPGAVTTIKSSGLATMILAAIGVTMFLAAFLVFRVSTSNGAAASRPASPPLSEPGAAASSPPVATPSTTPAAPEPAPIATAPAASSGKPSSRPAPRRAPARQAPKRPTPSEEEIIPGDRR